jgi:hypothetical protein
MVPPSKTLNGTNLVDEHKIILEIKPTSGDAIQSEITLISPDDNGDSTADGFLSGRKYNITIEIYSPTKIQAKATLAGWASPVDLPPIPVYSLEEIQSQPNKCVCPYLKQLMHKISIRM